MGIKCHGRLLDCSQDQQVQANPDISGLGAIIAFAATSVFASLAILIAYAFDALPEDEPSNLVNSLDRAIINWTRKKFRKSDETRPYKKKARAALLERFVLVLSDQQLVTGIAVLASGYINRCVLSTYHFLTITCLGWFAATVHLSTLTVLRNYFKEYKIIRYMRFIAMLAMGTLLFLAVLIVLYGPRGDCTMPVQCILGQKVSLPTDNIIKLFCILFQLSFIVIAYSTKSTKVFLAKQSRFQTRAIIGRIFRNNRRTIKTRRAQYVGFLCALSRTRSKRASVKAGLAICSFMFMEFLDSFLWQLIWVFFMNFYGIRQIFWAKLWLRETLGNKLQGDENQLSFGQLVPLLLLVLPALTLIEGYEEARKESMAAAGVASQLENWTWPKLSQTLSSRRSSTPKASQASLSPYATNDLLAPSQARVHAIQSGDLSQVSSSNEGRCSPVSRSTAISFAPDTRKLDKGRGSCSQSSSTPILEGTVSLTDDSESASWSDFWQDCQTAYPSSVCWGTFGTRVITVLFLYALISLGTVAWFMAGQYDAVEFRGVAGGIGLVLMLMIAATPPYIVECARWAGH